ncbi:MAG TPA: isochorismatase family protein [Gemmatimonadales bacterium]|nr:isochorismatase family protein [Gemmatimonadales bacterium]
MQATGGSTISGVAEHVAGTQTASEGVTPPAEALLIVDAQVAMLAGEKPVASAADVLAALARLSSAARVAGALVVYLQNDGLPGSSDAAGTDGWQIHPQIRPAAGDLVLRKAGDDGFAGTELERRLVAAGVHTLAVGGCLSEMCVAATARSATERGFATIVVRGAHGTHDLGDIPASVVARVAEHALGDGVHIAELGAVQFRRPAV